ncbi:thioesterase family protein [Streptomyces griseoviridis]|uniref:TesB-like acyl-CoA thioesterase 3 n=1 Tax=Streptomyces griseoviridis TaxID=45398 RepID=A0A3S9ZB19_STRGD|nr:thioesterase family protein [Streptomyces griseoviridis]AZS84953.1 thioesterase family protein [Streptomyces griseoviridis]QCN88195.1 TesB-like acyl-CoA thioesterase 3 [Streptomyces griseoviridis]
MSDAASAPAVRAAIGDSEFDRDTALVPRGPGVHDIDLSAGWTIMNAVNGGYLLAVIGRALGQTLPHADPFTISAHYLTASRPGPAVVRTETVRTGRTLSTGQASLVQYDDDGTEVERIRVLASYGDLDALPDDVRTTAEPPAMPPLEQCVGAEDGPAPGSVSSPIADRLRLRLDPSTLGWAVGAPSGRGEMRAWFALADGRDADPLSLLLAVDALPPTAFEIGLSGWVPTVEMTVHVRRRPAPGPLRVSITTRNLAGGFLEEDAEVWDSDDRLVAQSRQLARVRLG